MEDIKKSIKEVLEKGYLMSLGTVDEGGVWVADVIYIFDDELNLYWMSDPNVRHSKAILKNPQVANYYGKICQKRRIWESSLKEWRKKIMARGMTWQ